MNTKSQNPTLTPADLELLTQSKELLEGPSFLIKLTHLIGKPLESLSKALPQVAQDKMAIVVSKSLEKALNVAIKTIKQDDSSELPSISTSKRNTLAAGVTGALGGFLGYPGLSIELPVTTILILRSILQIAQEQGEDIYEVETKLQCLSIFALGGKTSSDDGAETGYYAIRVALSQTLGESVKHLAEHGISQSSSPILMRFLVKIAARFGIQVSEKAVAQMIPVVGAVGGATINTLFIQHFQKMASGHFAIRRLERTYGKEQIQALYEKL